MSRPKNARPHPAATAGVLTMAVLHAVADGQQDRIKELAYAADRATLEAAVEHLADLVYSATLFGCKGDHEQTREGLHLAAELAGIVSVGERSLPS